MEIRFAWHVDSGNIGQNYYTSVSEFQINRNLIALENQSFQPQRG